MAESVKEHSVVGLVYTLFDADGNLRDESSVEDPLYYIQGTGQLLPKVEEALLGQVVGFTATLEIPAADAYGEYDESLVAEVKRGHFPKGLNIEEGMKFDTVGPNGEEMVVEVVEVEGDTIVVDGNHPLAGEDLRFELTIHSIRPATEEEITHGHVHGPGGHLH